MTTETSDQIVNFAKTATFSELERVVYDIIVQGDRWTEDENEEIARFFNADLVPGFIARVSAFEETTTSPMAATMTTDDAERVIYTVVNRLRTNPDASGTELASVLDNDAVDDYLCEEYIGDLQGLANLELPMPTEAA